MRFALVSTHTDQTTGYSKVVYNLLRQVVTLAPKVRTYHFGFQRHPHRPGFRKCPEGVIQYDAAANEDPKEDGFGFNKIEEYIEMVQPDVVMIYNDPLIVCRFIEKMKHERGESPYKLWIYLDQVYPGIAPQLMEVIRNHSDRIYVFSEIWKTAFLEYGYFPDVRTLEHAVDPTMFSVLPDEARSAVRKNMNVSDDAILFLNPNRNSQRKRIDLSIAGFTRLIAKRPTEPIYLVIASNLSPQTGAHYDIQRIFGEELKLAKLDPSMSSRLLLIDTSTANVIPDDGINGLYNACDIGLNTSDGEGFGLCQLEHMYTGAPQIVMDVGSYRTFLDESVAEFIPPGDRVYFPGNMPLGGWTPSCSSDAVCSAMERAINTLPEKRKALSAYKFKSWGTICDGWLEDVLTGGDQVSTVSVPMTS